MTGFLGLDRIRMPDGARFYRDDPVARHGLLVAMFSFATEWEDGEVESGSVAVGHGGFGYSVVHRGDQTLVDTAVQARVETDAAGYWPERIGLRMHGVDWDWLGDPALRFVHYGEIENPQVDGLLRRVGERRRPRRWFAQGETVPGHGNEPRHALS